VVILLLFALCEIDNIETSKVYVSWCGSMGLYRCREGTPIPSLYCPMAGL